MKREGEREGGGGGRRKGGREEGRKGGSEMGVKKKVPSPRTRAPPIDSPLALSGC